ncbi:2-C-methyl-D-erythritol 4-phosphate cytidylyltransferase [Porphyromonas somerae]|uniref:2-C-methyl-D-erythritol 4-phosphate cytidylyltransferase n=1 Tax=Porphyromonas somerae TaxID=322095 RepID=UPI002A7FD1C2|nr:2-C-methyl-D-erythritol 4-phosphate cytidylyltransferase [Porphyromonas somerae]MDY3884431.1 2-C-methyl-D-erythritol 4-phosphate cytidylyltransferase [Porphyromonas somerae]
MAVKELSVVVVAGGSGRRMGTELPKQYLMLKDQPIIIWTLLNIYEATQDWVDSELILVRPSGDQAYVEELLPSYLPSSIQVKIADGGKERADSVQNGLALATGQYVMIHDGVRPFVTREMLQRLWSARQSKAVIPAILPTDSIRLVQGDGANQAMDRSTIRLVQTPQLFDREVLVKSYQAFNEQPDPTCTDDASIVERYGGLNTTIVEGEEQNIKLTTPKDRVLAEWIMEERVGNE